MPSREEVISRIRTVFTQEGAEGVARAYGLVAEGEEKVTRTSISLNRAFESLEQRYVAGVRDQRNYARVQEQVNAAVAQNPALQDRANAILAQAAEKLKQVTSANENYKRSLSQTINERFGVKDDFSTKARGEDIAAYGAALDNLRAKYNPLFAAGMQYKGILKEINDAAKVGAISEKERIDVVQRTKDAFAQQVVGLRQAESAHKNFTSGTKATRYELINLSRQFQDIGVSLASGQNPLTVIIQQGSQVFDVFASSSQGAKGLLRSITALITPTVLLGAGVAALAVGGIAAFASWKSFALQLDDTARIAGTATKEMAALQAAASFKGIEQTEFTGGVKSFSAALYEARSGAGDLYRVLRDNKIAAGEFSETFEKVLNLVARARGNVGLQFSLLQQAGLPATLEWVRLAEDIQKAKAAAAEFGGAANENMIRKAREVDEAWNRFWTNFSFSAKQATVEAVRGLSELGGEGSAYRQVVDYLSDKLYTSPARYGSPPRTRLTVTPRPTEQFGPPIPEPLPIDSRAEENRRRLASEALQMEQQRLQLLGDLATASDRLRLVEIGIAQARLQPRNQITDDDVRRIMDYARASEQLNQNQERLSYLGDAATETEKYAVAAERLGLALKAGKLGQDDFNRAVAAAHPLFGPLKSAASEFATGFARDLRSGVAALDALNNALNRLAERLIDIALNQAINGLFANLASAFGGGLNLATAGVGATGPALGNFVVGHSGGVVGSLTETRYMNPAYFENAPRFAAGLNASAPGINEVPVLAHRGEVIGWPEQMRAAFGGGNQVQINVYNQSSDTETRHETRREGNVEVHDIIIASVKRGIARGEVDPALSGRFGARVPTRRV